MRWSRYKLKDGSYAEATIASDAGYLVTRTRASIPGVMGLDAPYRYLAFKGISGSTAPVVLGGYDTPQEAKQACEAHAAQSREVNAA